MKILVTGGAGYIGSHAVRRLIADGHRVVVLDNLNRGHREAVPAAAAFEQLDLRQTEHVAAALKRHHIEAVYHFAALAYVGESVHDPLWYYDNNTTGSISLLRAMHQADVRRMVFSSTCATYGEPDRMPITEDLPQAPINPYGMTKLIFERVLKDYAAANPRFAFTALRYFNVAGSAADGSIGEDHKPETHLIPLLLEAAMGKREGVTIFGDDYPTPDGTCIRDYIHVEDLIDAHVTCMAAMKEGEQRFYNLGIGRGYSVKEVVEAARRVTGKPINTTMGHRRAGDPPQLYADAGRIQSDLGWKAAYTEIEPIIETAWRWFRNHPDGYGS
jgi:UDP-glucose 4-epimerase